MQAVGGYDLALYRSTVVYGHAKHGGSIDWVIFNDKRWSRLPKVTSYNRQYRYSNDFE
jgi:hypothetical protein